LHQVYSVNPLNAELSPICHLLALLVAHPISHVSRIRVKVCVGPVTREFTGDNVGEDAESEAISINKKNAFLITMVSFIMQKDLQLCSYSGMLAVEEWSHHANVICERNKRDVPH
jgi:hypothetical protein